MTIPEHAEGAAWIGVDIGGTHFSAAIVRDGEMLPGSYRRVAVDAAADAGAILEGFAELLKGVSAEAGKAIKGVGIAMPGPFDYAFGISRIEGLNKYEKLFGLNMTQAVRQMMEDDAVQVRFENDAACFGLGAARLPQVLGYKRLIVVTLGTGLGACFIDNKELVTTGEQVPPNGYLYNMPLKEGMAEDYLSARWLLKACAAEDVRGLAERATTDADVAKVFLEFGGNLQQVLAPWVKKFGAEAVIIGGGIAGAYPYFAPSLDIGVPVIIPGNTERVAIAGAASLRGRTGERGAPLRKTTQGMLPKRMEAEPADGYTIFPSEPLGSGRIYSGYEPLARWIAERRTVRIDGFAGVDWHLVRERLCAALRVLGGRVLWYEVSAFLRSDETIGQMVAPFVGGKGAVWGTRTTLKLGDYFTDKLREWRPERGDGSSRMNGQKEDDPGSLDKADDLVITILAGTGAGVCAWDCPIVYVDLPKNELQYRMRAGSATNLGSVVLDSFAEMYKRSYFVDWVVLEEHRRRISHAIAVVVDGQHEEDPNWAFMPVILEGLKSMVGGLIRPRPWFEPGVWGGQWLKRHIPALSREEVNYAWSFELIAPENGIVFSSGGLLLEIAFDWLMQWQSAAVLGVDAERFGEEFPIRFDFLDTFGGGNLSIQCHPSLSYIQEHFGEKITQDETYYMLDTGPGSGVYLGFQEGIDPVEFRAALEGSQASGEEVDIEAFVQLIPANKHDLFLIPNQTIHGSGVDNLVLEISATPYIYTFKMYDWMRPDLNGKPRPINIEHAFRNLDFSRNGDRVREELISRPSVIRREAGVVWENLPTHPEHFYAIERITLETSVLVETEGKCQLLMVVEGSRVRVDIEGRGSCRQHFAETFVIPASVKSFMLVNEETGPVVLIKAFIKNMV